MQKIDISTKTYPDLFAIIDDEDFERVSAHRWSAFRGGKTIYAVRYLKINGIWKKQFLHRFLLNPKAGLQIDHINRIGWDCQKHNLRTCNAFQNQRNQGKSDNKTSIYKGVSWHRLSKGWVSFIYVNSKNKHLGYYKKEEDAAKAYDTAAKKYYGEFARLNFPEKCRYCGSDDINKAGLEKSGLKKGGVECSGSD